MPGSLRGAVAVGVLPNSLYRAFSEAQPYLARLNEYHDGSSQRNPLVTGVRRSWRLAKRLTPAELAALRTFWLAHIGAAFYFYPDPRQYDATGVSTTGRYLVRFNSAWQESVGIALSDVPVELIEVSATTGAGGVPPDGYPVQPDASDRTGVWLAMATSGEVFGSEYIHVHSGYADDAVASPPSAIVGVAGGRAPTRIDVALTSPLHYYPTVGLGDLMPPPFAETDEAYIEWPQINADVTHLQGADRENPSETPAYTAIEAHMMSGDMHNLGGPHTDITKWFGTSYGSLLVPTRITSASEMGYRDDNANTIPEDLLSWWMKYVNSHSGFSGPGTEATLDVYANYLALYYRPLRIRCGGGDLQTTHLNWPAQYPNASKTYTWGADRRYSGGESAAGYIGAEGPYWERWPLFATIRQGADFTYTIPRNLFRDYYDTVRYKVEIGLADPTATGAGQNIFSVLANGVEKLSNLDTWNETNPGAPVLEKSFEFEMGSFANNGQLSLRFIASAGMAKVSYINVLPMIPTGVLG